MRIIGIDVGLAGGIAVLNGDEVVLLTDLPVHKVGATNKKTLRAELDLYGVS
jgi:hypothetical protein